MRIVQQKISESRAGNREDWTAADNRHSDRNMWQREDDYWRNTDAVEVDICQWQI